MSEKHESIISGEEMTDESALRERITQRAYELYELRGREDGFDLQDWLQAEREVLGQTKPSDQSATVEKQESESRAEQTLTMPPFAVDLALRIQ